MNPADDEPLGGASDPCLGSTFNPAPHCCAEFLLNVAPRLVPRDICVPQLIENSRDIGELELHGTARPSRQFHDDSVLIRFLVGGATSLCLQHSRIRPDGNVYLLGCPVRSGGRRHNSARSRGRASRNGRHPPDTASIAVQFLEDSRVSQLLRCPTDVVLPRVEQASCRDQISFME